MERVCVVGLEYIGLPTASLLATKGFEVPGVDLRPEVVEGYQLLARLHYAAGNAKEATDAYAAGRMRYPRGLTQDPILRVRLWPGVAALFMDWAHFLRVERRPDDAVAVYHQILAEDPRYVPAYLEAADLLVRQRRVKEASGILARGLENVPASEILWERWRTLSVNRAARWEQ